MNLNPLNPFAVSGLVITITYLILLIIILTKGKTWLSRIFALHIFCIFAWGVGAFLIGITRNQEIAYKIWIFADTWVIFIPVFFYHAVALMTKQKSRLIIFLIYLQAIIFLCALLKGLMIISTQYMFNSFYYKIVTPIFLIFFIAWAIIVSISHVKLFYHYKKCYPREKEQIKALLIAMFGFMSGISNFLPAFGIDIYPFGNFFVPIHSLTITYAILKHQLLDITVVFKRGLVYSILILIISLFYLVTVLLLEKFLQGFWGYRSVAISLITAFIIGIAFFPLHNRIQRLVDRFIFKKSPDEIVVENELLLKEVAQTEKLKTIATLSSGMAHEIKNPLTVIKTFSEYLPSKMDDKEFLEKFSRLVGSEVDRIDGLVNQLLDFAKPAPPVFKETNINKLLEDSLDFLNSRLTQQKITLHADLSPACNHPVRIDPNQIRQAFLNIALNAIEAMPSGGTLTIASRFTNDASRFITITISDTGIGIAQEDLPHIFDPFFSKKDFGTGLGLSITHGIIQEHGGKISVETNPGWGTTFKIELPAQDSAEKNAV